ncbi:MAG: hypothetical protein ACFFBI_06040 [Promethearchaeota archaeon]
MSGINEKQLRSLITDKIKKSNNKIKGKHPPIAEIVDKKSYSLPVKSIYDLNAYHKRFYFITVKNYRKQPKFRYFLAISLANSSSDLLVLLASNIAIENDLKLIQYSIYPKPVRIQLFSLKEIKSREDYETFIKVLNEIRREFRDKLVKLKNLIENK